MKTTFLLHFYQPHNQQDDILDRIVNESYRPLVQGFLGNTRFKVIVNINGALSTLLEEKGYHDVIEGFKTLAARGQIEFTDSAMYHAILPLIPEEEIMRQIDQNNALNRQIFGEVYQPKGFFSPEMAVSDKIFKIVSEKGYQWMPAPQLAMINGYPAPNKLYKHKKFGTYVFFRNKRVSSLVLASTVRDAEMLIQETKDLHEDDKYWFSVMDAETFGHHRIGHEKVLFEILAKDFFEPTLVSELLEEGLPVEEVELRDCTWTNTEQDFHLEGGQNSFILWHDPKNPIHKLQWDFVDFVLAQLKKYKNKDNAHYKQAREKMDLAMASDQFWWASVKPWWSLEMIEVGAHDLKEVITTLNPGKKELAKADNFYRQILDQAFEWQRSGLIRQKHLENSATFMKESFKKRTPSEWYNQIILEFNDEMEKAAKKREFEKAVKWRDAIMKLEQGTDIYDVLHVVDELWSARQIPSVKPFLEHNWDELPEFAKKHLQDAANKEEFEEWKKRKKEEAKL